MPACIDKQITDNAQKEFKMLVQKWAKKIGVAPKRVQLQRMTTKWASCSTAGQISFNNDILQRPRSFREAVIVHELVHLAVPNHGRLFKSMFLSFMPNGEQLLGSFGNNNRRNI
jgi:hypothetical protein